MNRRSFMRYSLLSGALAAVARPALSSERAGGRLSSSTADSFELAEATIAQLQEAMKIGKLTARSIAEKYLKRIKELDKQGPAVNSIIELNPDALQIADALDRERKSKGARPYANDSRFASPRGRKASGPRRLHR
jgi:amidase